MIIKMRKYSFLVYYKEYTKFLESIREQGVLHVKERGIAEASASTLRDKVLLLTRFNDAIRFLKPRAVEKKDDNPDRKIDGLKVLHDLEALRHELDAADQRLANLEKDYAQLSPWGKYDLQTIEKLKEAGWTIQFFSCPDRKWNPEWETLYNAFIVSQKGALLYFVTIIPNGTVSELDADPVRLPQISLNELNEQIVRVRKEKEHINAEFNRFAETLIPVLEHAKLKVQQEFDFDKVVLNTNMAAEDKVAVLEGFLPVTKVEEFEKFLSGQSVYYESEEPSADERVPVVLKNNWFARLFEPIGELYTLPNHKELDLTALYAPFYWLFFGFCLGDSGYGLILALAGFIMAGKVKPATRPYMKLLGFLGLSTIIFGIISGTCFGMNLYEMRVGFYASMDDLLKSKNTDINQALFNLAIVFGAIQIIYGMFVKAANEIYQGGIRNAFSTMGWILILFGIGTVYLMNKSGADPLMVKGIGGTIIGLGFLGAFIFSSPNRNVFANFGLGLWDTYNMATGLLGDLLSYIRLFALGICSGILGYVFNSLAISLAPDIPVVRFIVIALILIAGHTINMLMGILGSFVHPMRLTFVEFYKNAGFTGGGRKYTPFKTRID